MMRTKINFIVALIISFQSFAQTIDFTEQNITAPSASAIRNIVNTPVSISTGIPDISLDFFSLPTHDKNLTVHAGMSYHPNNTFQGSKSSELGRGWSLSGLSSYIYREQHRAPGTHTSTYYFNVFGKNGKFQAKKDIHGNLTIQKVTVNKFRISANHLGNDLYEFSIIDENGLSYKFDIRDISYHSGSSSVPENFTSTYYLSGVMNSSGVEILNCEYEEDNYTVGSVLQKPVKSLRIKKIVSVDFGSINISYGFDSNYRKSTIDPFSVNTIELKSIAGKLIKKVSFQSTISSLHYPIHLPHSPYPGCYNAEHKIRVLNSVREYDRNNEYKTIHFQYGGGFEDIPLTMPFANSQMCFPNEHENPNHLGLHLLSGISYPNGTTVKYYFELNEYRKEKNNANYLEYFAPPYEVRDRQAQYFEDLIEIPFDTCSPSVNGSFILSNNPDEADGGSYLKHEIQIDELYPDCPFSTSDGDLYMNFAITNGTLSQTTGAIKSNGLVNYRIDGTGGRGKVIVKRVRYTTYPIVNYEKGHSLRINKIETYDNQTLIGSETRSFSYQKFDDATLTSGVLNEYDAASPVVYKNVTVRKGSGKGYEKYYFKWLDDRLENTTTIAGLGAVKDSVTLAIDSTAASNMEFTYMNILKDGLLSKKEIYDNANTLLVQDSTQYTAQDLPGYYQVDTGFFTLDGLLNIKGKNGIITNQNMTSTSFNPSGNLVQKTETTRDITDFNITYSKSTAADGTVTEKLISYPYQISATEPKLWNANIQNIPLITEIKRNGIPISKARLKYEDVSHFYPTSQVGYLPDDLNSAKQNITFDVYDEKGNLVQYTTYPEGGTGIVTTVIWGYHKTVPIARVEGARLSDLPPHLVTAIVNASDADGNSVTSAQEETSEKLLIDALNAFRTDTATQNFMISCYTYNPLIGITNIIPPDGIMQSFIYDSSNRLHKVIDVNGVTVKEYQYNHRN